VLLIKHKFIGEEEMRWMKDEQSLEKNLLIWSAKESLFKWYAKGEVDFRKHLFLSEFTLGAHGVINGRFENDMVNKNLEVHYEIFSNCVMTWVTG
jgi:4'-phosphopantetheinyl transferase